jgi:hypothetical protein
MPIAADYPFLDVLWTMIIFFVWVVWIWMMIGTLTDVFRRRDIGGWAKAAWCLFMIVLPFVGVLVYLVSQHDGLAQRESDWMEQKQQRFDSRAVTGGDSATAEIEKAEQLLRKGTISRDEFETLKARALTAH